MKDVRLNSTLGFYVLAVDETNPLDGLAGLTISVELSKGGAAFASVSPTITDLGDGVYWVAPIAAHRNTGGEIAWSFSATGAVIAPRFENVVSYDSQDATRLGLSALPNAAADAAGGLPVSDAGGLDLDAKIGALTFTTENQLDVQVMSMANDTLTAAAIAPDAGAELAALVETYIVNEGDATAVIAAIVTAIDNANIAEASLASLVVSTLKADTEWSDLAAIQSDITSVLADTNELQADWEDGGRLDLLLDKTVDRSGFNLTILAGAISNAGTATEQYDFTIDGVAHRVAYAGLDASGNRGTTVLSKP